MSPLENAIVGCLANSFITDHRVDPAELARFLHPRFPSQSEAELGRVVTRIALGIGVRIKGVPNEGRIQKAVDYACA